MTQLSPLQRPSPRPSGSLSLGRAVCAAADCPALTVPGGAGGIREGGERPGGERGSLLL